jgi:hypothetical protein
MGQPVILAAAPIGYTAGSNDALWSVLLSQLNDGIAIVGGLVLYQICVKNEEILWPHGALTKSSW